MNRDELIMRHYDGELGEEDAAELDRLLASDLRARAELERLRLLGDIVREARPLPDIDLSASVFESLGIDTGPAQAAVAPGPVAANQAAAGHAAPSTLAVPTEAQVVRLSRIRPAGALAGVSAVLAAAAAVALWLAAPSAQEEGERVASSASASAVEVVADVAAPAAAIAMPDPEPPEQSVAVERVDFGSSQGAIFLVPNADERTLVVWTLDELTDDDEGEEADL